MTKPTKHELDRYGEATRVVLAGRDPHGHHGFVNPPVYHGSTVLAPTMKALTERSTRYVYHRRGNPTAEALEEALASLSGAAGVVLCPSGLNAIATALLAVLSAGDHLLMTDSVYGPGRHICDTVLKRHGIETSYYDPLLGEGVAALIRPNTRAIYCEAPGSLSFEMQDIPAIVRVAREREICVLMDNTWATPLYFEAHSKGVDVAIMAGTKYIVGHSDVMLGTISASESVWPKVRDYYYDLGNCVGPDDVYLAQRGLRTLAIRLKQHHDSGLAVARWLQTHPLVERVLHPALQSDPGHAIWQRDFRGASGLFSLILKPGRREAVAAMLDGLKLFGMGYSWGGYESLAIPFDCKSQRTATAWRPEGPAIRLHIGLEDVSDLKADLEAGLERFGAAA